MSQVLPLVFSLLVNFLEKFLLDLLNFESFIDSLNISREDVIELEIEGSFCEVLTCLFLGNSLICEDCSGIEVVNFDVIASLSNNSCWHVLINIESFVTKCISMQRMDKRGSGCHVDSFQSLAEHSVAVIHKFIKILFESFIFQFS